MQESRVETVQGKSKGGFMCIWSVTCRCVLDNRATWLFLYFSSKCHQPELFVYKNICRVLGLSCPYEHYERTRFLPPKSTIAAAAFRCTLHCKDAGSRFPDKYKPSGNVLN